MNRGRSGRAVATVAAVIVAAVAAMSGCSAGTAGTPTTAVYRPLSGASVTAAPIALPEGALAVAPDGRTALARTDGGWCLQSVTRAAASGTSAGSAEGTATAQTDSSTAAPGGCLDLPDDAGIASAAFSPDGTQLVVTEDFVTTLKGRMWLVGTADRAVREVAPTGAAGGSATGSASASASTTPPTSTGSRSLGNGSTYYLPTWDRETGGLFALEFGMGRDVTDAVVRVDRPSATATVLATLPERASGQLVAGGGVVVAGTMKGGTGLGDLVVLTESNGTTKQIDATSELTDRATNVLLTTISPDGKRLVAVGNDQRQFQPLPPMIVPLDGGAPTTLSGFDDMISWGSAYSPDGALLAVLTSQANPRHSTIQLVEGTSTRALTDAPDTSVASTTLEWSRSNVLAPRSYRGELRGNATAWQLSD